MKRCFKCLCEKPLDDFYKHSAMKDGHLGKCKDCTKSDATQHRLSNLERVRSYDRLRGSMPHRVAARKEYQRTPAFAESHEAAVKRWQAKHPERRRANNILDNAVRKGRLTPWPVCAVPECCGKPEGHHPDYSRPLDVVWLCAKHHKEVHALARKAA